MANDYNVIFLDDDERNARPLVQDGRRPMMAGPGGRRPMAGIVVPPSTRPTVIQTGAAGGQRPYYPASSSGYYPPSQPSVVYHQPAPVGSGLAGMSNAELIELAALALTALQPLPGAPTAQGDVETDVENLVLYQSALAGHAKQVDRIRVLAEVIGRVIRK